MASIWEFQGENHILLFNQILSHISQKYLDEPYDMWENIMKSEQTKVDSFGSFAPHYTWIKITAFQKQTINRQSNMEEIVWRIGAAFLLQQLDIIDGIMNSVLY